MKGNEIGVAIVSLRARGALARLTVDRVRAVIPDAQIAVLDVDGSYRPFADEVVLGLRDVMVEPRSAHRLAMTHGADGLMQALYPKLVRSLLEPDRPGPLPTVLALRPGVLALHRPTAVIEGARSHGTWLCGRSSRMPPDDGRWPGTGDLLRAGMATSAMVAVHNRDSPLLDAWDRAVLLPELADRWMDPFVTSRLAIHGERALLSAWNLRPDHSLSSGRTTHDLHLDGAEVGAIDLSNLDPARPWLMDATIPSDPRARLSEHPALATLVAEVAEELRSAESRLGRPAWDLEMTAVGIPVHPALRAVHRTWDIEGTEASEPRAPDPYDPDHAAQYRDWLIEPINQGPGRYLRTIHGLRPDLQRHYPDVPGDDTEAFLRWTKKHGSGEGYTAELIDESVARARAVLARPTRPGSGVNVVGFLTGELGLGESARLMLEAFRSAGVPHTTIPIRHSLMSRTSGGAPAAATGSPRFDTTLICVNADLVGQVESSLPVRLRRSYRIGMWYWEVEDFPEVQHAGFAHVDEVWVASDFIRHAIEPHSPVPVRTMTPPLPQRRPTPTVSRTSLGVPEDRPIFLFSFDFLSTAERKNPLGLIDAFTSAFSPGEGPVLVIKSINGDQRPAQAEHLRIRAAGEPDVILLEGYLDATERDALMALCDCYVSLHRSEGLGLTMAEAMAWGKPVIATGYSGNLQFMTERNSYLVPWDPTRIPPGADPYPAGGTWAEPDLAAASRLMRAVLQEPEEAARRGSQAAEDIRTLHAPVVAGQRAAARLEKTGDRRRALARWRMMSRLRAALRAGIRTWQSS